MKNQKPLQLPVMRFEEPGSMEASIEEAMQRWLDNAQQSNDARDRIAVASAISPGVFGKLHLGADESADSPTDEFAEPDEFKRAA